MYVSKQKSVLQICLQVMIEVCYPVMFDVQLMLDSYLPYLIIYTPCSVIHEISSL